MSKNATPTISNLHILKQYVDVIQQFKVKKGELEFILGSETSLPHRFYKGIIDKSFSDDAQASRLLYNEKPSYPPYKVLKTELKKKLMHAVLLLDSKQPEFNDMQQAYYQCQKNWATITILTGRLKIDATIDLAQTTLDLAQKFDLTEVVVNTSRLLARKYHSHRPLSRNAVNYDEIHEQAFELLQAENLAERYYDDILRYLVITRIPQLHLEQKALEYLKQLEPFFTKYQSHRLHLCIRLIQIYRYTCANNFKSAYQVANEAITFFENKPYELKNPLAIFLRHKTNCCMLLKKYEEGEESAQRSRALTEIGTHNWFRDSLLYVQFSLHTEKYQRGWEIYLDMIKNKHYAQQNQVVKDEMSIVNAYLQFFIRNGIVEVAREDKKYVEAFDIHEFLMELKAVLPNSKTGAKVPVLVAQLMWLVKEKKQDSQYWLDQCRLGLKRYRTRHTDEREYSYRTNLFVGLCMKLGVRQGDGRFLERPKVEKASRKLFEKLKAAPQHFPTQAHSVEVLPYDIVWQEILKILPPK
jgi:head-tail adaptor